MRRSGWAGGDAILRALIAAIAFVLFTTVGVIAADQPIPPAPSHWATDTAGFLSATTVRALDGRLQAYEASTHHQVLVYVCPSTGDTPLEQWTVRAFEAWRVGRKGLDDGLVLFVFSRDRKARIEVGYGMEEMVPDATAARIIRDGITPWFVAGDPDRGVTEGVSLILRQIGGESDNPTGDIVVPGGAAAPLGENIEQLSVPQRIALLFLLLMVSLMIVRHPWIALYLLVSIIGGGRGGGGSIGGGGFSGGGGRSGGGGASGSW
jgi:uncharacterized protein